MLTVVEGSLNTYTAMGLAGLLVLLVSLVFLLYEVKSSNRDDNDQYEFDWTKKD